MKNTIYIIDDFYVSVDKTRNYILTTDFNIKGNFPGFRTTSYADEKIKTHFEKLLNTKITHWDKKYNGSFQYTTQDMDSWIHRDTTEWGAILYLTPNAPADSGTAFFKHKLTGIEDLHEYNATSLEEQQLLDKDSNDMSKWEMVDYIGNKYNRLVLFRGTRNHRSMKYFGTDKHNGRLFQLWFFNTENFNPSAIPRVIPRNIPRTVQIPQKNICILMFTTSRYEYLIPTLKSFHQQVDFANHRIYKILIDDYPLRRDVDILKKLKTEYSIDKLILNEKNLGYSLSWKLAWENVPPDTDYIWHQEDDFTFNQKISVDNLIDILDNKEIPLFQVFLKRNIVFETNDFIRDVEQNKLGIQATVHNQQIILQRKYFNSNPGIYHYRISTKKYSTNPQEFIIKELCKDNQQGYSAMYGGRHDANLIKHIGEYTQGKKVIEGEPGWSYLKEYHPDKKYYSAGYLKLYPVDSEKSEDTVSDIKDTLNSKSVEEGLNQFDKIFYINLEHRKDRRKQITNELAKIGVHQHKIEHFNAIYNPDCGAKGCSASHLAILQLAKKRRYKNYLVFEDDFEFIQPKEKVIELVNTFFEKCVYWDIIMLSGCIRKKIPHNDYLDKVLNAQTTSGYAVYHEFYSILEKNFSEGLSKCNSNIGEFCIDQYWKHLQPNSNWYIFKEKLGKQRASFSDIEKKNVDYNI